ncbi:nuclease [Granulicella cerasi]|uniref:Nuclease n=1 Tax=Granulicella cerasi TaxID=741063 RepID=A0ABW1Z9V5_9BACT|nr:nuclease [Granulicella cerasi]
MRFPSLTRIASASALIAAIAVPANAWGPDGHMMINRLAALNLPADVPSFVRDQSGAAVIEYLGPEPDRWRNKAESELAATQAADHFIDMEWANYGKVPCGTNSPAPDAPDAKPVNDPSCVNGWMLPRKRFDFLRSLAAAQAQHPKDNLSPEGVGLQPWQVEEVWQRLKVDFREYRALKKANKDTHGVETAILFDCGWLGHYVGDGSQPLHVSIQYNGWTGPNPNGYTTAHKIHWQFENNFVINGADKEDVAKIVAASKAKIYDDEWIQYFTYLHQTGTSVQQVYKFEKAGALNDKGTPESRAFVDQCLANGAIELRDLIYSAWVHSADPVEEYNG